MALDPDDAHPGEVAGRERAQTRVHAAGSGRSGSRPRLAEVHHAVDLRRLSGRAALEGERRILAGAVDQNLDLGPEPLGVQLPGDALLALLDARDAVGRDLGRDLVGVERG